MKRLSNWGLILAFAVQIYGSTVGAQESKMSEAEVTKHEQTVPEERRGNFAELFVGDMSKIHPVHVCTQGCGNRKHTYGLVLSR